MIISGIWWLVINIVVLALLYIIATIKSPEKLAYPNLKGKFSHSTMNDHQDGYFSGSAKATGTNALKVFNPMSFFNKMKAAKHLKARQGLKTNRNKNSSKNNSDNTVDSNEINSNEVALQDLSHQLEAQLPDYQIQMKKNYINIMKASKKLLMITLDKDIAMGNRKLGGVTIVNFHDAPDYKEVKELLAQLK